MSRFMDAMSPEERRRLETDVVLDCQEKISDFVHRFLKVHPDPAPKLVRVNGVGLRETYHERLEQVAAIGIIVAVKYFPGQPKASDSRFWFFARFYVRHELDLYRAFEANRRRRRRRPRGSLT
jgi:hypothetical protein